MRPNVKYPLRELLNGVRWVDTRGHLLALTVTPAHEGTASRSRPG